MNLTALPAINDNQIHDDCREGLVAGPEDSAPLPALLSQHGNRRSRRF